MSQDNKSGTFKLNPSAMEFVPTFNVGSNNGAAASIQPPTSQYQNKPNNYNNNYNSNNQRYYNNNYNNNNRSHHQQQHRNNNYHQNNYNSSYNNHNNNYYYQNNNSNDVDPIEIEARCEAVIEILQDDKVRDHLNPESRYPKDHSANNVKYENNPYNNNDDNLDGQCDDEEELLEMLAMQEECRLEMMKFYIQSQNPNLFEEIYHDVSYPEGVQPVAAALDAKQENKNVNKSEDDKADKEESNVNNDSSQQQTLVDKIAENINKESNEFIPDKFVDQKSNEAASLVDKVAGNMNKDTNEFIPEKLADLKLNESESKK